MLFVFLNKKCNTTNNLRPWLRTRSPEDPPPKRTIGYLYIIYQWQLLSSTSGVRVQTSVVLCEADQ
jgi:hypothetical protein